MAMCGIMATVLLSLLSLPCLLMSLARSEPILIVVLPQSDTEVSASWERGEEILSGAKQAIEEAKNDSLSFNLSLVEAYSGPATRYDLPYSGNVLEVIANLAWQNRASDIIGIAGFLHPNVLAIISRFQLPIVSLVHFDNTPEPHITSSVRYMTASTSVLTQSILAFMKEMRPKKIGIITETNQPYYFMVSHELHTKTNLNVALNVQITPKPHRVLSGIADRVFASNAHVILLSADPSTAVPMLCEAYKRGLTWPTYAWILHSYRFDDLLQSSSFNEECTAEKILEGVIIFQLTKEQNDFSSEITPDNPYAGLLYNSVRQLISSANNSSSAYYESSLSHQFSPESSKVYIYHNLNGAVSLTSIYDGISRTLTNVSNVTFTDYDLPLVHTPLLPLYILPIPILCFLFNTALLVLYIVFRNEKSVKSSSVSLSMMMFVGCYLMIIFVFLDIISDVYRVDLCMLLFWMSFPALALPLVLAVLLMKLLRVYRIFTTIKLPGKSRVCKDYSLVMYTLLIILPPITLLVIRTAVDPSRRVNYPIEHPGFIEIQSVCESDHWFIWYFLMAPYLFPLIAVIIFVAIKTRKIRQKNFKDTKKVNLLVLLIFCISLCGKCYLIIFFSIGLYKYSAFLIYGTSILVALICQFTLFVPKLWPPLLKKIIIKESKSTTL